MKPDLFKVGDVVSSTGFPAATAEKMVIEQVYSQGKAAYYLCSYVKQDWSPSTFRHDFLRLVK